MAMSEDEKQRFIDRHLPGLVLAVRKARANQKLRREILSRRPKKPSKQGRPK